MGRCERVLLTPPFHGSRSSREMKIQNASCQMGGREVTGSILSYLKASWSRHLNTCNYLAAQCEIPPISRNTFLRWYRRGGYRTHLSCFHVVSRKYRWDTPKAFVGRSIAPPLRMLSGGGKRSGNGGGGIAPNWPCWDTKNPMARDRGGLAEIVSRYRAIRGH